MAELSVSAFTVYDLITRGAAVHRDAPAVIQGERVVCFRELRERVDALAAGLAGLGIGAGERVCVLAQNDAAYLELYGACARQGIVAYPINWRLTGPEVERVVDRARPRMMVIDQSTRPLVADWLSGKDVPHRYRLTGPAGDDFGALADLYGSAAAPETAIWAVLSDVAPDGSAHPVATGRLLSAYPRINRRKSLRRRGEIVQPYGVFRAKTPIAPGAERLYRVELWPVGNRFAAGHRMRLQIVGASAASAPGVPGLNTVSVGAGTGSRVLFPVLPGFALLGAGVCLATMLYHHQLVACAFAALMASGYVYFRATERRRASQSDIEPT